VSQFPILIVTKPNANHNPNAKVKMGPDGFNQDIRLGGVGRVAGGRIFPDYAGRTTSVV
jgi:hypothetical protein